ncbi:MAG TPA: amino acid adenylation domain-containing protein, partial [Polyangiaceae bacterium]|nr:amino acid adenylation domain-containing protein [Polyangiaceae bacterium]
EVVRRGRVVAFAVEGASEAEGEGVAVMAELARAFEKWAQPELVCRAISEAVSAAYREPPLVVLVKPGTLPLTSSGKLQRAAARRAWQAGDVAPLCVYREGNAAAAATPATPAKEALSPTEQRLAELWRTVLGGELPGKSDGFFARGGTSLQAVELGAAIERELGVELSAAAFDEPTLAGLARHVDAAPRRAARPEPSAPRPERLPLSDAERRIHFASRLDGGGAYNIVAGVRVEGELRLDVLGRALDALVARHEPLRSVYPLRDEDGLPERRILAPAPLPVASVDLSALPADARAARVAELEAREASAPFDLGVGPLLRVTALRLGARQHRLVFSVHHIVADGRALDVLLDELTALYAAGCGEPLAGRAELAPLGVQYADHALGEQGRKAERAAERERAIEQYRRILGDEHPLLELPADYPRPAVAGAASGHLDFRLEARELEALRAAARARGVTPFSLVLAAFQLTLQRLAGRPRQVRVGVPVLNRHGQAEQRMVGCFINTLVVATDFDGAQTFAELLGRARDAARAAQEHQRLPFEELVEALAPERSLAVTPLFQVMLSWRPEVATDRLELPGATLVREPPSDLLSKFDLTLHASELPQALALRLVYKSELFEQATVERFRDALAAVLAQVVADPERRLDSIYVGPAADRACALGAWSPAPRAPRQASLHGWVRDVAARWPERRALRAPDGELSYAELAAKSRALAVALAARGVVPGARVALLLERSTDFVVALLAVLERGAAYVPLDPEAPAARLAELCADAAVVGVIEHAATAHVLVEVPVWRLALESGRVAGAAAPDAADAVAAPLEHPELPAYVLYTSGSTGRPKGVAVTQRGAVSYTEALLERLGAADDADQWALVSTLSADLGNTVLFGALCSGRCLHLLAKDTVFDPDAFAAYMSEHAIAVLKIVPSHLAGLLEASAPGRALPRHALVLGGEATSWSLVDRIQALGGCRILNHYGPTETTVGVLTYELSAAAPRPIARTLPLGRPLANASVYVLDADGQPAPVGVAGEVYIGGHGVAQGYLARPALTAERFVPDPYGAPGARLYRTGDRARYLADGSVEFLGRWDEQIKLRGYRIELGEIRARLRAAAGVSDALVRVLRTGEGRERLVAYVVGEGAQTRVEAIESALAASLPEYMRPSEYVLLSAFPLTPNGKIDTRALPAPAPTSDAVFVAPRGEAEQILARVWCELLGLERVSVRDNFFKLGGDSITTLQVVARARRLGLELSPKQLFEHQTIESAARTARLAAAAPAASGDTAHAPSQPARPGAARPRRPRGEPAAREDFPLARLSEDEWRALPVASDLIEDIFPLSPMQQGMLLHTLLEPGSGIYLMQDHYRVEHALDAEAFATAWRRVIARHAALRASFVWQREENMLQIIHRDVAPHAVEVFDWSGLEPAAQERELERFFAEERRQGYDLAQTGSFRIRLFQLGPQRYHFVQSRHHILLDAWCRSLLLVDFFQIYRELTEGVPAELASPPEYGEFIAWLGTHDGAALRAWWKQYLSGFEAANPLSVARALPRGARISAVVDAVTFLSEAETRLFDTSARALGVTPNTLAQAAWALVLGQYSGQRDLVFGVTVAGRPAELEGIQDTVGLFINTLPLRVAVPGPGAATSVASWLEGLQAQNVALRQHEQLSLVEIQAESAIARGEQLFHSLFVFENAPLDRSLEGWGQSLGISFGAHRTHTNYPVTVVVIPGKRAKLIISYDERLFEARDVERMLACYRDVLLWLADHPEQPLQRAPRLRPAELEAQAEWNRTEREYPLEAGYAALFEEQVARQGERTAVRCGGEVVSYRELDERATAIGRGLSAAGVSTDEVVGVYSERGIGFIASVIGAFKAGGAYVPLDPKHPEARMLEVLGLSRARVVVTSAA